MKKIISIVFVIFIYFTSTAQTENGKEALKTSIRDYVIILNEQVVEMEAMESLDSIHKSATAIRGSMDSIFIQIDKVYQLREKARDGGMYLAIASTLEDIVPMSGVYFQLEGLSKLLYKTDNTKYFKKLSKVGVVVKKLQKNNKQDKLPKLMKSLVKQVARLNEMELK